MRVAISQLEAMRPVNESKCTLSSYPSLIPTQVSELLLHEPSGMLCADSSVAAIQSGILLKVICMQHSVHSRRLHDSSSVTESELCAYQTIPGSNRTSESTVSSLPCQGYQPKTIENGFLR